jgi:hypothetical protein
MLLYAIARSSGSDSSLVVELARAELKPGVSTPEQTGAEPKRWRKGG